MERKIELTLAEIRNIFIAGMNYEKDSAAFDMDEVEEVTELDFGEFMKEVHNIEIQI